MKITVEDLSFAYAGRTIFSGLSLELESSSRPIVILGTSGSGKTTFIKLLGGLLQAQSGRVSYSSGGDASLSPLEIKTAFMFQEARLLPWLSALENIRIPYEREMSRAEANARAKRFLSLVSLDGKESSLPLELSGGEAQRVSMARAFALPEDSAGRAPVLFMDEAFQSLDIPLRIGLMDSCLSLLKNESRLLIAVTHDPREAIYMGGRIIIIGNGGRGIVFDKRLELSPEEREWTSGAARDLEKEIIASYTFPNDTEHKS